MVASNSILVMIPTYNERQNVAPLAHKILESGLAVDILFIDDNSPDGTGQVLETIKGSYVYNNHIQTIHYIPRSGKLGVGSAHKDGIKYAYAEGYRILITMDCDGTHDPSDLKRFLQKQCDGWAIVVGTRHAEKESLKGWSTWRKFVTGIGHLLTQVILNLPFDATGAYRLYDLSRIPQKEFIAVQSNGYEFFYESLTRLYMHHFAITEIPIILSPRSAGSSKLKTSDLPKAFINMVKLRLNFWRLKQ
jgi:dolichol-phosphate mannosyltransferase